MTTLTADHPVHVVPRVWSIPSSVGTGKLDGNLKPWLDDRGTLKPPARDAGRDALRKACYWKQWADIDHLMRVLPPRPSVLAEILVKRFDEVLYARMVTTRADLTGKWGSSTLIERCIAGWPHIDTRTLERLLEDGAAIPASAWARMPHDLQGFLIRHTQSVLNALAFPEETQASEALPERRRL